MPTLLTIITLLVATVALGGLVLVTAAAGLGGRLPWLFDNAPRWWARALLASAGVHVRVHGAPSVGAGPWVYASNHVSWFDILALISALRRFSFIAKAELFRVPLFGPAARAVGTIPIQRENRKSAFDSYEVAAGMIRSGRSVIVFPEGTRGSDYALRPFKKGPFVLAIAAGAPVVPTIVHGTIRVNPRGSYRAHPGDVDVHFLEPVPTAGLTYADRDRLAAEVWRRMADAMERHYGVRSEEPRLAARGEGTAA